MFKLEERKKVRAHLAAVNSGAISDPKAQFGTDASGNVLGDEGKPVEGTAPKGFKAGEAPAPAETDYTKLTTHADLDAALGSREKPEGWDDREKFKVAEKQAWLAANPANGGW